MNRFCTWFARGCHYGILLVALSPSAACAHAVLDSPLGGESLAGGFSFPIRWHVSASHITENWDLWYSTDVASGYWITIAADLPKGDISDNAPHSFDWQVPNSDIETVWVRVQQDNAGTDYDSISTTSFNINAAAMGDFTGNNIVDGADLAKWQSGFGINSGAFFPQGDDDFDGDVDGNDFLRWQRNHGFGSSLSVLSTVSDPSSLFFLISWCFLALIPRRDDHAYNSRLGL